VFEYAGTAYAGQPLGVVLTGAPDPEHLRPDAVLRLRDIDAPTPQAAYVRELAAGLGVELVPGAWGRQRLELYARLAHAYGRLLRSFAEAGCFRYSSESANFYYSASRAEVAIVDIDTSRLLDDVSAVEAPLQIVRDAMSGLFHLACEPVQPEQIDLSPPDALAAANPYRSFLESFFPELELPGDCCAGLLAHVREAGERIAQQREAILGEPDGRLRLRAIWLDTMLLYVALTRLAFGLYERSSLAARRPLPYDGAELDRRLRMLAGADRLARAQRLAEGSP
jgi:hypothetical protein